MDFLQRAWNAGSSLRLPTPVVLIVWGFCGWQVWKAEYIGTALTEAKKYVREVKL